MTDGSAAPRPLLLVEDDENDVYFFQRALAKIQSNLPIQVIGDGQAAWEYLSGSGATHRPTRPSLIILDLKLPRKSGLEILTLLKRDPDLRSIPVIVMTSSRMRADIDAVYALGADFYLVKSPDFAGSVAQARGIHAYWISLCGSPDDPGADPTLSLLRKLSELASSPT
jgi:CheY-like chemotaxis protein